MDRRDWPAVAAWAGALALLCLTAWLAGFNPFSAVTWARWDSAHYESIARGGYEVHRCAPGDIGSGGKWCGNAAWLPSYPLLMAIVHAMGVSFWWAGLIISWLFAGATLVLLWRTFLRDMPPVAAAGGLIFAAVAPGLVYRYAVYPLSMFVFFTVAYLASLVRERWATAGLVGAVAVITYPIGVTLPAVAAAWIILTYRHGRSRAVALAVSPALVAVALLIFVQRIQTGRWTAFFDVQSHYGAGIHDPIGITWNSFLLVYRADHPFGHNRAGELQTVIVAVIVATAVAYYVARWRTTSRADHLLVIWAAITWAFPATQANVSLWRHNAALTPLAVLVARLPRPVQVAAILAVAAIAVPVAWLYFENRLV
jgi:hypothetical protein